MPRRNTAFLVGVNASRRYSKWPVFSCPLMAGFGCPPREGLIIQIDEGDAENLPYPDASFDVVMSLIGSMFAPRPELVASEMIRVCRPGGRIIMGNGTRVGHVGQMFKVKYVQVVRTRASVRSRTQRSLTWE